MAPPDPIPCSVAACKYKTPESLPTFEMMTLHLELHVQAAHTEVPSGTKPDGNAVGKAVGQLIQIVKKPMTKKDYSKFCRKVPKYLYNLDPKQADFASIKKIIEARQKRVQADPKNVFSHIKDVLDELRKYQKPEEDAKQEEAKQEEAKGEKEKSAKEKDNKNSGKKKKEEGTSKRKRIVVESSEDESDKSDEEDEADSDIVETPVKTSKSKTRDTKKKPIVIESSEESEIEEVVEVESDAEELNSSEGNVSEESEKVQPAKRKSKKRAASEESEEESSSRSSSEERVRKKKKQKKGKEGEEDSDYNPETSLSRGGKNRGRKILSVSTPGSESVKTDTKTSSRHSRTETTSRSGRKVEQTSSKSSKTTTSKSSNKHQSKITTFITTSKSSSHKVVKVTKEEPPKVKEPSDKEKRLAEKRKDEGNNCYKLKKYDEALEKYNEAIELYPQCAAYYGNRSAVYLMLQDPKKATDDALTSTNLDDSFEKGWARLARCSIIMGDTGTAKRALTRLPDGEYPMEKTNVELLDTIRGDTLTALQLGDNKSALYCMEKALELATHSISLMTARAECLARSGRFKEALQASKEVLQNDKANVDALYIRGLCHYFDDDLDKAIKVFGEVVKVDPKNGKAMDIKRKAETVKKKKEAGITAAKAGKLDKAYELYSEAIQADPQNRNAKLFFKRAMLGSKLKKEVEYLADCDMAIEIEPNYTKALVMRAKGSMKIEKYQVAVKDFENVLKDDDTNKEYKALLAEAKEKAEKQQKKNKEKAEKKKDEGNNLYKKNNFKDALEKYSEAIELFPCAPFYGNRAACYLMMDQPRPAMEDAKIATTLDATFVKGWTRLLRCSILLGLTVTARQVLGQVEELSGKQEEEQKQVEVLEKSKQETMAAHQAGDIPRALECMETALQLATHSLPLKAARAECLAMIGRLKDAKEAAGKVLMQDPMNADANYVAGLCFYYNDDMAMAFQHFQVNIGPGQPHVKTNEMYRKAMYLKQKRDEANSALRAGNFVSAFRLYTAALSVDPTAKLARAKMYCGRADCAHSLKYPPPEIIADCESSLELDPSNYLANLWRGKSYMVMERWNDAMDDFEIVVENEPNNREYQQLLDGARQEFEKFNEPDFYELLGVLQTATDDEIKKSYRKLSLTYHPDKQHGKSESEKEENEQKFKKINEAYAILSDEKQRWIYDGNEDHAGGNWGFQNNPDPPSDGPTIIRHSPPPQRFQGSSRAPPQRMDRGEVRNLKCHICGNLFAKESSLKCHITKAHTCK